tara:strand:- start:402 stop:740 length:339 start_codon:yes stop_codon:yes gene_type:complete
MLLTDQVKQMLPEEIEYIIEFKFGTALYRKNLKQWGIPATMVHYELMNWHRTGHSLSFLRGTYSQRKRGKVFKESLKNGSPKMTCHVGLFCNPEEVQRHKESRRLLCNAFII